LKPGVREKVKVMIGGAPVTRNWADEIKADGYAEDAMGAVQVARQLTSK
jgi:5-methyltetrahydrofolate--homocysteine methyltransferase